MLSFSDTYQLRNSRVEPQIFGKYELLKCLGGGMSQVYVARDTLMDRTVAVKILSDTGAQLLTDEATARDFVADAYAHCKFIGHTAAAIPLLEKAGIAPERDSGIVELKKPGDAAIFAQACRQLRFWERETTVKRV